MRTISTVEVVKDLPRFLAEVEGGEEFVITREAIPVARLSPFAVRGKRPRPKVGEMLGPGFEIRDDALAPLSAAELEHWGL
jgi:antitoxin (DNA-binding transcriptional repressor) of toxin-antitoxin stability system